MSNRASHRTPMPSRRALLRAAGVGSGALALPWLEVLAPGRRHAAHAAPAAAPKRLVCFFSPGGTIMDKWRPTGGETTFTLSHILEPLAPFRKHLIVLDGLEMRPMNEGRGHPHQRGMGALLTGQILPSGKFGFFENPAGFPNGVSLDQAVGARVGAMTKFKTLEFGVLWPTYGSGPAPQNILSYAAPGQPSPPMGDPWAAWMRLFADLGPAAGGPAATRRRKTKMVLDAAAHEYGALGGRLGGEDRRRLDEHLERMREIAVALDAPTGAGVPACTKPDVRPEDALRGFMTGAPDTQGSLTGDVSARMPRIGKLMMDMLVMSLACDLTRVASIQWTDAASRNTFPFLNLNQNHHFYQHDGGFQPAPLTTICRWYMDQLAYLCGRLAEVREGDGTLLDNTVIFAGTEISHPDAHDNKNMPFLLVGGAGGSFRTGRYLRVTGLPHNNLLVSLQNAFGIESTTFGDPKHCTGPLANLTA